MYLLVLFYFLNFCVRPTVQKRAVLALAAGIKVFGPQKFFWQGIFTFPNFLILRTFFGVYSKNGETNILKIFNFEKFILSDLLSGPPISTPDHEKLKIFKMFVSPFFEQTPKKVRKIRKLGNVKIPYQKNFWGPKTLIPAARAKTARF